VTFPWRFRELGLDARHGIQRVDCRSSVVL
jgi:hypothetical protein